MHRGSRLLAEIDALIGPTASAPAGAPPSPSSAAYTGFTATDASYRHVDPVSAPWGAVHDSHSPLPDECELDAATAHAIDAAARHFRELAQRLVILHEDAELLRYVRERHVSQLEQAVKLLDQEQRLRKQRCNELQEELRGISQKKIAVLTEHVEGVRVREFATASQSSGRESAKPKAAASVAGSESSGVAPSHASGKSGRARSPQRRVANTSYACGPLTKQAASEYYATYWKRQAAVKPV